MTRTKLIAFAVLFSLTALAQPDSINQRIYLIGDAGEMKGATHPVIDWLKKNVNMNDDKNSVIFLGDNVYPYGLPLEGERSYAEGKRVLDYQISLVKGKKAKAYFIPGNHDWKNGKLGGWQQILNQVDYVNSLEEKNVEAWPLNGCPGPVQIEVTDKVVFALVDSQWFLYLHDKPGPGSNCSSKTLEEFQTELQEIADSHPNQMLVIAMHHPILSYGVHGGDFTWKDHIFPLRAMNPNLYIPLPVLGSVYPLARGVFGNVQDIKHPLYKTLASTVTEVMKTHPNPIFVAGHDHGLQMLMRDSIPYVVSGAGAKASRTKPGKYELYSTVVNGFSVIEVWKSGKTDIKFYTINDKDLSTPEYALDLKPIKPVTPTASVDTTRSLLQTTTTVAANPKLKGNGFKKFMVGQNYRKEWTTPITVPVLDLTKESGGLKPTKQGGGMQTKSLRVETSKGREYALRSIAKDPAAAIPPDLRQAGFVKDFVEDGISASYPYGALSMGPLSQAAHIPYLRDRVVYLPDDPRLDRFRANFKNTLVLLEERKPEAVEKTDNTDELFIKLAKDNDDHVLQHEVLKVRLLDNFVMDFDRHEGQWLWATIDTGKGKLYYPIPKDRDQVFYTNDGLIPKLIKSPWLVPQLQGFRPKASNIKTFNFSVRNFDRNFLTEMGEEDWRKSIDTFLNAMTDDVIQKALMQQPKELQGFSAQKIANTLKERRKYFRDDMMKYYRFISHTVTIPGTNQQEQFTITKNADGTVRVLVNKIKKDSSVGNAKIYDRVFDPKVTKELRLFGMKGDDRFIVEGDGAPIKIRIIGGSGNDEFVANGSGRKVLVYDAAFEKNTFSGDGRFRKRISANPEVNHYDRQGFRYSYFQPGVAAEYNIDDGLFIGPKFQYIKQGFRKEPYGMRHYLSGRRALATASYHFVYEGDFIKAIGGNDIVVKADIKAPINVTNFFGIGNNTAFPETNKREAVKTVYRARYNIINTSLYLRRQLQSWMRINIGPTFQYFQLDSAENQGRFVSNKNINGLDNGSLYRSRQYVGADARLDLNSKNSENLPTRGLVLNAGVRSLFGVNDYSKKLTQLNFDMSIFMSLASQKRLVLATRLGYGHNIGHYEFEQAQYLGTTENLRGYRKQRFAGRSMLFNNTELRIKLKNFNTYLFPGSFGAVVFNDIGRVWAEEEHSERWHDGYGLGIWLAPIQRWVITVSLAHSKEEKALPRASFGFQF